VEDQRLRALPRFDGHRALVVGLGRSGAAAARLLAQSGAAVTVTDRKSAAELASVLATLPAGVSAELGEHRRETFLASDVIVLSPGVPPLAEVAAARTAGVSVIGEIELGARFLHGDIVGITGTNGKSTTTTLAGDILAATGRPTFVGGNLGVPLVEAAFSPAAGPRGIAVVEVSSFQLETIVTWKPRVGVLLNITADHLDRYDGMEGYAAAKARMFENQTADDFAVLNIDDPRVATIGRKLHATVVPLSTARSLEYEAHGGWVSGEGRAAELCLRLPGGPIERYSADLPGLYGRHNQENALAASLSARLLGASAETVLATLRAFRPLPHRMILVGERNDVAFFDDSKGTNVGAVVAALTGFPRRVVLIAGGRDKGGSYEPLADALRAVGRAAVLLGEAAERIGRALEGVVEVVYATSMDDAVARAATLAQPGDAVVLSPACSSFDMFTNYGQRGDAFVSAVTKVIGVSAGANEGARS
jgi:UDP-N-acetylmuramoylalanine--D-glutamate ligase